MPGEKLGATCDFRENASRKHHPPVPARSHSGIARSPPVLSTSPSGAVHIILRCCPHHPPVPSASPPTVATSPSVDDTSPGGIAMTYSGAVHIAIPPCRIGLRRERSGWRCPTLARQNPLRRMSGGFALLHTPATLPRPCRGVLRDPPISYDQNPSEKSQPGMTLPGDPKRKAP